jgi:CRP/FNR family transcriptional regulator
MPMKKITRDRFLRIFPIFQKASPALVSDILSYSEYVRVAPNAMILMDRHRCPGLILMLSGEKRIFKASEGREITLGTILPGEFCMLSAACTLSNTPYPANAISLTDIEMLIIPSHKLQEYIHEHKEMRDLIFSQISKRFAGVMELITEVTFKRMDERLTDYLIEKSEDGKLSVTHQAIANELGTAREVVSRLLKDFERRGLIILSRNCIRLTNLKLS